MKLYDPKRENIICTLKPTVSREKKTHQEEWIVEFEHDMRGKGQYIEKDKYILVDTPKGNQYFKIRVVEVINESKIKVTAFHRMYDLCNNYIEDTYIQDKNRVEAAKQILSNTLRPNEFEVVGHTGVKPNNLRIVGYDPFKALVGNDDNTLISRFGGEWDFDNNKFIVEDYIGRDNGYLITYNKGMIELNENEDSRGLVTQLIPIGRERLMLPELTVDSFYINNYEEIYTKEVDFNNIAVDEDKGITKEKAEQLLREAAQNYFLKTQCDLPQTSYKIVMEDIKNNYKYKDYKFLYKLDCGDYVTVLKNNGTKLKVRLKYYERDTIKGEFVVIELNNTVKKGTADIKKATTSLGNILNQNGSVNTQKLEGIVNLLKVSLGAMVDSAELHNSKAILFEDRVVDSPTYGALAIGTKGFMIASEFDATKDEWEWSTFGTGQGFVADHIVTGVLTAILIKSLDDKMTIDLSSGTIEILDDKGVPMFRVANNKLLVVGDIHTFFEHNYLRGISLQDGKVIICSQKDGTAVGRITSTVDGNKVVYDFKDDKHLKFQSESQGYFEMGQDVLISYLDHYFMTKVRIGTNKYLSNDSKGIWAQSDKFMVSKDLHINGNMVCVGTKNNVVDTRDYNKRLLYATEDAGYYFTYTYEFPLKVEKTESGTYEKVIIIDNIYKQTVNTAIDYIVDIHKVGWGDYRIKEQTKDYFIVESDREEFEFKYTIKAKRLGYENYLLDEYKI